MSKEELKMELSTFKETLDHNVTMYEQEFELLEDSEKLLNMRISLKFDDIWIEKAKYLMDTLYYVSLVGGRSEKFYRSKEIKTENGYIITLEDIIIFAIQAKLDIVYDREFIIVFWN